MTNSINLVKTQETERRINGFRIRDPRTITDYIALGLGGVIGFILSPIWGPFWLLGKLAEKISTQVTVNKYFYSCPDCDDKENLRIICRKCGWNAYLDNLKIDVVENENKN